MEDGRNERKDGREGLLGEEESVQELDTEVALKEGRETRKNGD